GQRFLEGSVEAAERQLDSGQARLVHRLHGLGGDLLGVPSWRSEVVPGGRSEIGVEYDRAAMERTSCAADGRFGLRRPRIADAERNQCEHAGRVEREVPPVHSEARKNDTLAL